MYKIVGAILLLAAAADAQLVGWRNCGSPLATIQRVFVKGCTHTPCSFPVGHTIAVEVAAVALSNSVNLPFGISARVFNLTLPNLVQGNACEHFLVGSCPALHGASFVFRFEYGVLNIALPGIPIIVVSHIYNDFGDVAACIEVDAFIAHPTNEINAERSENTENLDEKV